ncbi:hypothetical protein FEM08_33610 [Flavobacterium gilvum]|nr:hypothetical protein FEM08_33610 [Flavobacterium gilvum]
MGVYLLVMLLRKRDYIITSARNVKMPVLMHTLPKNPNWWD